MTVQTDPPQKLNGSLYEPQINIYQHLSNTSKYNVICNNKQSHNNDTKNNNNNKYLQQQQYRQQQQQNQQHQQQ